MKSVTTTVAALAAALVVTPLFADPSLTAVDSSGKPLDMARSRASIERTPPERTASDPKALPSADPDAIRFVVSGKEAELPKEVMIVASDAGGAKLDEVELSVADGTCPTGLGPVCRTTALVRPVADEIDRDHPLVKDRSIRAEVGGALSRSFGWSGAGRDSRGWASSDSGRAHRATAEQAAGHLGSRSRERGLALRYR